MKLYLIVFTIFLAWGCDGSDYKPAGTGCVEVNGYSEVQLEPGRYKVMAKAGNSGTAAHFITRRAEELCYRGGYKMLSYAPQKDVSSACSNKAYPAEAEVLCLEEKK
jgi:hypothetical protein